ncbi:MAG: phage major tail tube protein [Enterocloster clostridioformis]|nr:phage major tail tube protein [Enterocloster clostridioformis]
MGKIDELIVNFALYEDATEYLGMAEVTFPEISNLAEEINGAGIAGNVEAVVIGHLKAMTTTLTFRTVTAAAVKLNEPRVHNIDCRVAQQNYNTRTAQTSTSSVKHILKLFPKKFAPGKAAVASTADASGEYATRYYAMYLDGKKVVEVDPLNFIYMVNGKDYLADVRKALGK